MIICDNGEPQLMVTRTADRTGAKPSRSQRYLPILGWLPRYERKWFAADTVAGLSVWALLVPQSLAYASLVGVPVQYGLYAAFAALIVMSLAIIAVKALDLTSHGVAVTGNVPTGLFSIGLPDVGWSETTALAMGALSVIFVGYSESLAASRTVALKHGYEIDAN